MLQTACAALRQFSVRLRMLGAVLMVLGMFALVGATALLGGLRLGQIGEEFSQHSLAELETAMALTRQLDSLRLIEKQMVIDYESSERVTALLARWHSAAVQVEQLLGKVMQGEEDEDNAQARVALKHLQAYRDSAAPVLRNIEQGQYDSAGVAERMLDRSQQELVRVAQAVDRIAEIVKSEALDSAAELRSTMLNVLWVFCGVLALVVLLVAPLTLLNSRSITHPLADAVRVARAIADGDLTQRVDTAGRDELATLLQSLQHMQERLRGVISQVHEASQRITSASAEVASGNGDLSTRTEHAAGALQQTASSVEQLAGTVRETASGAGTAHQLARGASDVAKRGGEAVQQVVQTMGEINDSSRRIGQIIGTIDGIAFQTNILALNAAVEAARAGEQGRGFAVVAGEVRSLAQRSAEAAREIKSLVQASVERVDNGTREVQAAGSTMTEIVSQVQRVAETIAEISAAASEQSQGIGQVSGAVAQLDQSTQQNAALVEQSAAAAEALREQAERLVGLVATFRLRAT